MTPDMSPATKVDAATAAVPLAADTMAMATWITDDSLGFEKVEREKSQSIEMKICLTPAEARDPQYQSQRGGARSERAGPVSRPGGSDFMVRVVRLVGRLL